MQEGLEKWEKWDKFAETKTLFMWFDVTFYIVPIITGLMNNTNMRNSKLMDFKNFTPQGAGAGSIWVNIPDLTSNLAFLREDVDRRMDGLDSMTCTLESAGEMIIATDIENSSNYFTFKSKPVSQLLQDGKVHLCFIKDMDTTNIHKLKAEIVVTFDIDDEEDCDVVRDGVNDDTKELYLNSAHPSAIIFDTETSGLTSGYNVLLQLSYQIVDLTNWSVIKNVNHFFDWPEDEDTVDPEAIYVNGLTQEFLENQIISDKFDALNEFYEDLENCDLAIAHNLSFDKDFIEADSLEEFVISEPDEMTWPSCVDTMLDTTYFCRLQPMKNGEYKWPKLSELAEKLHVKSSDLKLHDSRSDVELTKRCFQKLCENGFYQLYSTTGRIMLSHVETNSNNNISTSFISKIIEEVDAVKTCVASDSSCLSSFAMPTPNGDDKDVQNYVSAQAYSYIKKQQGMYYAKFTFQNMIDRIDAEVASGSDYTIESNCINSVDSFMGVSASATSVLQNILECFETIINERFLTFYGKPGEPCNIFGLCAVADFYAKLTGILYKMYLAFDKLEYPDKYANKFLDIIARLCFHQFYQAKSLPKDCLENILDFEAAPSGGNIDLSFNMMIDEDLLKDAKKALNAFVKNCKNH